MRETGVCVRVRPIYVSAYIPICTRVRIGMYARTISHNSSTFHWISFIYHHYIELELNFLFMWVSARLALLHFSAYD